jgi:hypothetical protein
MEKFANDQCIEKLVLYYYLCTPEPNRFHVDGDGGIYDDFGVIDCTHNILIKNNNHETTTEHR